MTFTYFILKLYGDHIRKRNMLEMNEYMHIIGKILEENHNYSRILMNNVLNGTQELSYKYTEMDVRMNSYAHSVMGGKSKSIILRITKWTRVEMILNAQKFIALTSTLIHKREVKLQMGLGFNQRIVEQLSWLMTT